MVTYCGGLNVFANAALLTPIVSWESVLIADPDVILMSNSNLQNGLEAWRHFPNMHAVTNNQIVEIPPDLIQRHTPRILEGTKTICKILANASKVP